MLTISRQTLALAVFFLKSLTRRRAWSMNKVMVRGKQRLDHVSFIIRQVACVAQA